MGIHSEKVYDLFRLFWENLKFKDFWFLAMSGSGDVGHGWKALKRVQMRREPEIFGLFF